MLGFKWLLTARLPEVHYPNLGPKQESERAWTLLTVLLVQLTIKVTPTAVRSQVGTANFYELYQDLMLGFRDMNCGFIQEDNKILLVMTGKKWFHSLLYPNDWEKHLGAVTAQWVVLNEWGTFIKNKPQSWVFIKNLTKRLQTQAKNAFKRPMPRVLCIQKFSLLE